MHRHFSRLLVRAGAVALVLLAARFVAGMGHTPPKATNSLITTWNDDGIQISLRTLPGPYFPREMLPVTLTLTNHTRNAIGYTGSTQFPVCASPLFTIRQRNTQQYLYPDYSFAFFVSCPFIPVTRHLLAPGSSLRTQATMVLATAGELHLYVDVSFAHGVRVSSADLLPAGPVRAWLHQLAPGIVDLPHMPFASGWPKLDILVSGAIPPNRTLHIRQRDHTLLVPNNMRDRPALVTRQEVLCDAMPGVAVTGSATWVGLTSKLLTDAGFKAALACDGPKSGEKWNVDVGAPGYAVTTAVYCFGHPPDALFGGISGFPGPMGPKCTVHADN